MKPPNMRHTRDNPYAILILAIPFVVGGIILLLKNTPGIVPAYPVLPGSRVPDATGFYVETASVTMVHVAGCFGIVVAGIIIWFYFKIKNG
jgi:hypothetical protein